MLWQKQYFLASRVLALDPGKQIDARREAFPRAVFEVPAVFRSGSHLDAVEQLAFQVENLEFGFLSGFAGEGEPGQVHRGIGVDRQHRHRHGQIVLSRGGG